MSGHRCLPERPPGCEVEQNRQGTVQVDGQPCAAVLVSLRHQHDLVDQGSESFLRLLLTIRIGQAPDQLAYPGLCCTNRLRGFILRIQRDSWPA